MESTACRAAVLFLRCGTAGFVLFCILYLITQPGPISKGTIPEHYIAVTEKPIKMIQFCFRAEDNAVQA